MDAKTLESLAARCEAAQGADRELDALIWCALNGKRYSGHNKAYATYGGYNPETQVEFTEPPKRSRRVTHGTTVSPHAAPVTASLNAAMTLVPEGWRVTLEIGRDEGYAFVRNPVGSQSGNATANDVALALTAACLRALTKEPTNV